MNDPDTHDWNGMYSGHASDQQPADPRVVEIIDTLPPGRALDVGCGAGGLVAELAQRGWEVTGIDIATRGIAAAHEALAARGLRADLQVADASHWQPTSSYDLITSTFALPGSKAAQQRAFTMMRAALSPGGRVLIKDFDATMKDSQPALAAWHLPTVEELVDAFEGLEVIQAEVVPTPVHDHDGTGANAGQRWSAALFHARMPR